MDKTTMNENSAKIQETVQDAGEIVREKTNVAMARASSYAEKMVEYVKNNPLKTMAIMFLAKRVLARLFVKK